MLTFTSVRPDELVRAFAKTRSLFTEWLCSLLAISSATQFGWTWRQTSQFDLPKKSAQLFFRLPTRVEWSLKVTLCNCHRRNFEWLIFKLNSLRFCIRHWTIKPLMSLLVHEQTVWGIIFVFHSFSKLNKSSITMDVKLMWARINVSDYDEPRVDQRETLKRNGSMGLQWMRQSLN